MKVDLKIYITQNGVVMENVPEKISKSYTFDELNVEGLRELLLDIRDTIHINGRYDMERVVPVIMHGDKYECPAPKACDICGSLNGYR